MLFETWVTFVIASAVVSIIPGPSVFTVLSQSIAYGLKPAFFCILGDVVGAVIVMLLSYAGIGAILAASAALFFAVKWLGVLYVVYLGVSQILEARKITGDLVITDMPKKQYGDSIKVGLFTGLLNPKGIMFSMAFLSQFIDANANPVSQFFILMASSASVIFIVLGTYALLAVQAREKFKTAKSRKRMGFLSGGFLFSGGAFMVFNR